MAIKITMIDSSFRNVGTGISLHAGSDAQVHIDSNRVENVGVFIEERDPSPKLDIHIPREALVRVLEAFSAASPGTLDQAKAVIDVAGVSRWEKTKGHAEKLAKWLFENPDKIASWVELLKGAN